MGGTHSNDNLMLVSKCQYIDYAGASESVFLSSGTLAVSLYSDQDCWVVIGAPGELQDAAAPVAEKTTVNNQIFLPSGSREDWPVAPGQDGGKVRVSVIQDSSAGTLYITERKF